MPHNRDASHDIPPAAPPSAEALVEAGRQVANAYPTLFAHQRAGVAFLLSRRRAILADDMGLGKSRQAIVALRESAPAGPYLVICPAGVKLNWQREIGLVEPTPDVHVVHSSREWRSGHRWTVVNYDLLGRLRADLQSVSWAGIVVDEAHYVKNDSARTTNVLRLLGADGRGSQQPVSDPEAVYLLTGTPMSNRPRDLFNLLRAVKHPLGQSFFSYAKRYCAGVSTTATDWTATARRTWRSWHTSSRACCCAARRTRRSTFRQRCGPGSPLTRTTSRWWRSRAVRSST